MSRASTQAKVALDKREHPERYCTHPRCLWRVMGRDGSVAPCRRHPPAPSREEASEAA